jgi:energy-coupling factor transport system permease protein
VRPLPVGLVCGGLLVASVAADHPFVLAACAAGSLGLLLAAGGPAAPYCWFAGISAVLVFAVNPFVAVQGLTPIWHGPHLPLLDTEITQEELAYGAAAALRIAGSTLAVAAFVRLVDSDRLLRAVALVAPRSAMIGALGARLLPTLERDAAGIALTARGRGMELGLRRNASELVAPLVSLSLERSLMLAEAMEARGYGAGPRTRRREPPAGGADLALGAIGAVLVAVAALLVAGFAPYRYYDLLGDPFTSSGVAATMAIGMLCTLAAGVVRWTR